MNQPLPYVYRWNRCDRKGQSCRILARSRRTPAGDAGIIASGQPLPKNFNSILIEFSDGFTMVTSGNAIRKVKSGEASP